MEPTPTPPDTHDYWEARAPYYMIYDVLGRRILEQYMAEKFRSRPIKSLLDVGCGRGELFPLWKELGIERVVGLDFSENMLEFSRKRIERHGYDVELHHMDLRSEALDERFDVAVTRTVLMHIQDTRVESAAVNLAKMSNTLLLFEYFEEVRTRELNRWCWLHDYPKIFKDLGYDHVASIQRPDMAQMLFHFEKR